MKPHDPRLPEYAHRVRNQRLADKHRVQGMITDLEEMLNRWDQEMEAIGDLILPPTELFNPTGGEVRVDPAGDGHFGAPRGSHTHKGLDLLGDPGQEIKSPLNGLIARLGRVYADTVKYQLVELTGAVYTVRLMYCALDVALEVGRQVLAGTSLGILQDITERKSYREQGMEPHLHLEIRQGEKLLDPEPLIFRVCDHE